MTRKRTTENDLSLSGAAARRKPAARTRSKHTSTPVEASKTETSEPMVVSYEAVATETVTVLEPTREEIAEQAYLYWEARGYQGGSEEADWLRAEQELRARKLATAK